MHTWGEEDKPQFPNPISMKLLDTTTMVWPTLYSTQTNKSATTRKKDLWQPPHRLPRGGWPTSSRWGQLATVALRHFKNNTPEHTQGQNLEYPEFVLTHPYRGVQRPLSIPSLKNLKILICNPNRSRDHNPRPMSLHKGKRTIPHLIRIQNFRLPDT